MSEINHIYTTLSNDRLHIAAETKYVGNVNSYDNWLTQFFAWLFRCSMVVNFDGKERSVNKKSYIKLLNNLNINYTSIDQCKIFKATIQSADLSKNNINMRDVINKEDRRRRFEKLAFAISKGDTEKAISMICKGADIDESYFDRRDQAPSFESEFSNLSSKFAYKFTVFKASPLLQAARKGNDKICSALIDAGADLKAKGNEYDFETIITHIEEKKKKVPVHHQYQIDNSAPVYHKRGVQYQKKTTVVVHTKKETSNHKHYAFDETNYKLKEIPQT